MKTVELDQSAEFFSFNIISISLSKDYTLLAEFSWPLIIVFLLLIGGFIIWENRQTRFDLVELEIPLGGVGKAKLKPNYSDIQIAHKIWTELVTRKAAIRIDPQNDVIIEVYDSWYSLFQKTRELISNIPAELIRSSPSTKLLVYIATKTLNDGLRPHLTNWQAKFRNWYVHQDEKLKKASPQEVQRQFPQFAELIEDLRKVNEQLISYAEELKKITDGK